MSSADTPFTRRSADEELQLMRLAHGELRGPEAQRLRERMEASPELAARFAQIEAQWNDLEGALPAPEVTPDIAAGVQERLRRQASRPFELTSWTAALATAALLVGVGLGWWVQELWQGRSTVEATTAVAEATEEPPVDLTEPIEAVQADAPRVAAAEPDAPEDVVTEDRPPVAVEAPPVERVAAAFDEDLDRWSRSLGDEPEWNEQLFAEGSERVVLAAAGLEEWTGDAPRSGSGWDASLADGWGLASTGSLALAYLDLEDAAASEGD